MAAAPSAAPGDTYTTTQHPRGVRPHRDVAASPDVLAICVVQATQVAEQFKTANGTDWQEIPAQDGY